MKDNRTPSKKQTLEVLVSRGIPVRTVVDVGVLKGTPELISSYPRVKHLLFEPVAELRNDIARVYSNVDYELYTTAIGNRVGNVGLKISKTGDGVDITHSWMTEDCDGTAQGTRVVSVATLDHFFLRKEYEKPYLLKVDIDGQEMKVLQGASATMPDCSIIIIECQKNYLAERVAAVQSAGFELFDLCEPCYYDKAFWQCDAVFVRRDLFFEAFLSLKGKVVPGKYEIFRY